MSGWGGHLDDLADATAQLLANGSVHVEPLVNVQAALAARDATGCGTSPVFRPLGTLRHERLFRSCVRARLSAERRHRHARQERRVGEVRLLSQVLR